MGEKENFVVCSIAHSLNYSWCPLLITLQGTIPIPCIFWYCSESHTCLPLVLLQVRRFELKSPVKTIEDFIKRFTPSRLTSGSNSSSLSSLVTNRSSSHRGCSSVLSSPSAESTLTKLDEERRANANTNANATGTLDHAFSPIPASVDGAKAHWGLAKEEGELRYEAESPDEAALVYAARAYKCSLVGRLPDQVMVELPHLGKLTFELLHTLGFDSTRKRMSVVVKHPLTDQITVYTKGADSVIMDLIKPPPTGKHLLHCMLMWKNIFFSTSHSLLKYKSYSEKNSILYTTNIMITILQIFISFYSDWFPLDMDKMETSCLYWVWFYKLKQNKTKKHQLQKSVWNVSEIAYQCLLRQASAHLVQLQVQC